MVNNPRIRHFPWKMALPWLTEFWNGKLQLLAFVLQPVCHSFKSSYYGITMVKFFMRFNQRFSGCFRYHEFTMGLSWRSQKQEGNLKHDMLGDNRPARPVFLEYSWLVPDDFLLCFNTDRNYLDLFGSNGYYIYIPYICIDNEYISTCRYDGLSCQHVHPLSSITMNELLLPCPRGPFDQGTWTGGVWDQMCFLCDWNPIIVSQNMNTWLCVFIRYKGMNTNTSN